VDRSRLVAALLALASWHPVAHVPGIVDVAGPRADGQLVLSTRSGLFLYRPGGTPAPLPANGYTAAGGEPYTAAGCGSDLLVLDADTSPGVVRIPRNGDVSRLADLPAGVFPSGIAYDATGRFGHRVLVTGVVNGATTLYAIDCAGRVSVVTTGAPHIEGGIVVAPRRFGHFGGDLIGADENSSKIYAFGPRGAVALVADTGVAAGGDIGIEALGFVPKGGDTAYFSDLGAPGSPTEGTDSLLALPLAGLGLRPGDLLAASEGGAVTIAVRCGRPCTVRAVAAGPPTTHGEGHIAFTLVP
jgi:hypothetical protein